MRIELERILSLLPRKEDGSFVRGSKKDFARSIGYDSGDIVSMWIKGDSESYLKKLHEISAKYDVSVEWLQGKTDKKKSATPEGGGLRPIEIEIMDMIKGFSEQELLSVKRILLEIKEINKNA